MNKMSIKKGLACLLTMLTLLSFIPTIVSANAESESEQIYFEAPESWAGSNYIFCHISVYNGDPLTSWQSKTERCTLAEGNLYSYDTTKAGNLEPDVTYTVVMSNSFGMQTYETILTTSCLGDTLYYSDFSYENPEDFLKRVYPTFWTNQKQDICGPVMRITSLGNVVGTCIPNGVTAEDMFASFINYDLNTARNYSGKSDQELVDSLISTLNINPDTAKTIISDNKVNVSWTPNQNDSDFDYLIVDDTIKISRYNGSDSHVVIPDTLEGLPVTEIGISAFEGCSDITTLTIPSSLKNIDFYAFSGCTGLNSVYISDLAAWCEVGIPGRSYANPLNYASNLYVNGNLTTDIVIPDGVTRIGESTFETFSGITSLTVSDSTTSIGSEAFLGCSNLKTVYISESVTEIGINAFGLCDNLNSIEVSVNNANYASLDGVLFNKDMTILNEYPANKADNTYSIPQGVICIADSEFGAFCRTKNLESVLLPNSVTKIGRYAFFACSSLKSITIPTSVTDIDRNAFFGRNENLTIHGYVGSFAESYANENSINFVALNDGEPTNPPTTSEPNTSTPPVEAEVGDVNMDGTLNIKDATAIQKHLASLTTFEADALALADFDGDSKINVKDATAIQKKIAGLI